MSVDDDRPPPLPYAVDDAHETVRDRLALEWLPVYNHIELAGTTIQDGEHLVVYDPDQRTNDRWIKTDEYANTRDER